MRRSLALASLLLAGCTTTLAVVGTDYAPTIVGELNVSSGDGDTLRLSLELDGVPLPERIDEGATTYWAWAIPHDGTPPVALGRLAYTASNRRGELTATTTLHELTVLVTAEGEGEPAGPSGAWVARRSYPDAALPPPRWREAIVVSEPDERPPTDDTNTDGSEPEPESGNAGSEPAPTAPDASVGAGAGDAEENGGTDGGAAEP